MASRAVGRNLRVKRHTELLHQAEQGTGEPACANLLALRNPREPLRNPTGLLHNSIGRFGPTGCCTDARQAWQTRAVNSSLVAASRKGSTTVSHRVPSLARARVPCSIRSGGGATPPGMQGTQLDFG